jgi:hypothetical protein
MLTNSRKLSTFALTLFRKEVELDGENGKRTVKVGTSLVVATCTCNSTTNVWVFPRTIRRASRLLGHSRPGAVF